MRHNSYMETVSYFFLHKFFREKEFVYKKMEIQDLKTKYNED